MSSKIIHSEASSGLRMVFSPTRAAALLVLLSLAWFGVVSSTNGLVLVVLILILALLSIQIWRYHISADHPRAVSVLYLTEPNWIVQCVDGGRFMARLGSATFVDAHLAIIDLRPVSMAGWRSWCERYSLLLFPDQFDADEWHHLLLMCRIRQGIPEQ